MGVIPPTTPGFSRPASASKSWYGSKSRNSSQIQVKVTEKDVVEAGPSVPAPSLSEQRSDLILTKAAELMAGRNRPDVVRIPQRSVSHQAPDITVNQSHTPVRSRLQQYKEAATGGRKRNQTLDLAAILDGGQKFELQKIDPDFTDSKNEYFKAFEKNLEKLNGSNSSNSLCIEEYLIKSERQWYGHFKSAKLGRYTGSTLATSTWNLTEINEEGMSSTAGSESGFHLSSGNARRVRSSWIRIIGALETISKRRLV